MLTPAHLHVCTNTCANIQTHSHTHPTVLRILTSTLPPATQHFPVQEPRRREKPAELWAAFFGEGDPLRLCLPFSQVPATSAVPVGIYRSRWGQVETTNSCGQTEPQLYR